MDAGRGDDATQVAPPAGRRTRGTRTLDEALRNAARVRTAARAVADEQKLVRQRQKEAAIELYGLGKQDLTELATLVGLARETLYAIPTIGETRDRRTRRRPTETGQSPVPNEGV